MVRYRWAVTRGPLLGVSRDAMIDAPLKLELIQMNQSMKTLIKNLSTCLNDAPTRSRFCLGVGSKRSGGIYALLASLLSLLAGQASAQTLSNVCNFTSYGLGLPSGGVILSGSTLYGTAQGGNAGNFRGSGAVFAVNTNGTGLTNLHVFTATSGSAGFNGHGTNGDGAFPNAALVLSGNTLYGTTEGGSESGNGNVFAVNTDGTGFTVLHAFTAASGSFLTNSDGRSPTCGLVLSGDTLFGTASGGATGFGTVFAVNINSMVFTNIYTFTNGGYGPPFSLLLTNSDGINPAAGLILSSGILYGTAGSGSTNGSSIVFALSTNGTGFTNLHGFADYNGVDPSSPLILSGNTLYGTVYRGGLGGSGTVFALNTDGTGFTNLHDFTAANGDVNSDGALPQGALLLSGGILYGTTLYGGPYGDGTVFAVYTNGTGFSDLYDFTGYTASLPCAALILSDNTLYGTATSGGGGLGYGSVFALSLPPSLNNAPVITWSTPPVIYGTDLSSILNATANVPGTFDYSLTNDTVLSEGAHPITLIFTPTDTLYYSSVTDTVTQVVLPVPVFTTLHSFAELSTNAPYGNSDGGQPQAGLILSGNTLYGTDGVIRRHKWLRDGVLPQYQRHGFYQRV